MATTFHLTPEPVWASQKDAATYLPEAFNVDGFIHCTDGIEHVIAVGNRYYTAEKRTVICLVVDLDQVSAEVKYEDPDRIFPHIYGALETAAVVGIKNVVRSADGQFVSIE